MRIRLLIALAVVGFASPWYMVAQQMQEATALEGPSKSVGISVGRAQNNE
jgi:hypothetical protein